MYLFEVREKLTYLKPNTDDKPNLFNMQYTVCLM